MSCRLARLLVIIIAWAALVMGSAVMRSALSMDKGKVSKETLQSGGQKRTYYLFVPPGMPADKQVPLIVTLHGSGRDGTLLVDKWKDLAAEQGIILAGPDSSNSSAWLVPQDGPDFIHDLVEALKTKYPVDPRRVYLFGHSAGAVFALSISLLESEYFAATAVHAGEIEESRYWLFDYATRKIPMAIVVGTEDAFFPVAKARATRDALVARGFIAELTEIPRHTHDYYSRSAEVNGIAWKFLSKQALSADPRYMERQFK